MMTTPEEQDEACAREALANYRENGLWTPFLLAFEAARLSREREAARHAEPPVDQDVLDVRRIEAARWGKSMGGEVSAAAISRGEMDGKPWFQAGLAAYRAIKAERGWA